jgi:hypothetical protein
MYVQSRVNQKLQLQKIIEAIMNDHSINIAVPAAFTRALNIDLILIPRTNPA